MHQLNDSSHLLQKSNCHVVWIGWGRLRQIIDPGSGGIMWRTSMVDVQNEIGIPPKQTHLTLLSFNEIEQYFYNQQHMVSFRWDSLKATVMCTRLFTPIVYN